MSTMRVVAVIPARAGSKGIPGKNLRTVGGRTLVRRAVESAQRARLVDGVVVSTDGDDIAAEAVAAGARVVRRPPELSDDEASSESALLHTLDALRATGDEPQVLLFLQATSPFIDPADLDDAVARVIGGSADAVFAATPSHAFLWRVDAAGHAVAVNHDAAVRPRRQDREPEHRETGAFYALRTDGFREHQHRFFGRVEIVSVDPRGAIDIDDESDLAQAEAHAAHAGTHAGHAGTHAEANAGAHDTHHTSDPHAPHAPHADHHRATLPEPLDPQWWQLATTNGAP